jgi:hypothetical protein
MTYLQGECSYRRVEEEEEREVQHQTSACSQYPPCVARLPHALLSRAQRAEVLHRLGRVVAKQTHLHPPLRFAVDLHVKEYPAGGSS